MLSPLKAFTCVQKITGCSFLFSNLSKNMNNIALPAIALASGMYTIANAEYIDKSHLIEDVSYAGCIAHCIDIASNYENFFHELGICVRVCIKYFS